MRTCLERLWGIALLAMGAGLATTPSSAIVDEDHDGIDDALEQALAEKYAPVILMEPYEPCYPASVDWILLRATLSYYEDCAPDIWEQVLLPIVEQTWLIGPPWVHPDSWGLGHDERHCGDPPHHRRISTIAPDPESYSDQTTFVIPDLADADRVGSLNPQDWITYFHCYPRRGGGVVIQYWHSFAYNNLWDLDKHGGDWDATIHVMLDSNLVLDAVYFSRHTDDHPGTSISPNSLTFCNGTHPIVTIDGGGHAAYASPSDWQQHPYTWHDIGHGDIVWTEDCDDPNLLRWVNDGPVLGDYRGGTIWKTWTGGDVSQAGSVTHALAVNPSPHGGLINLGEYNPGIGQACSLNAGEFHPLNDQWFIEYSGRWGSPGIIFSGPRGPVFQGFDSGTYTAWYNEGSDTGLLPRLVPDRTGQGVLRLLEGEIYDGQVGPLCSTNLPYLISELVTVTDGTILTVRPGVTIIMQPTGKLRANGILRLTGNSIEAIRIVRWDDDRNGMTLSSTLVLRNGGELAEP